MSTTDKLNSTWAQLKADYGIALPVSIETELLRRLHAVFDAHIPPEIAAWDIYERRVYGAPNETFHRVLWVAPYRLEDGSTPDLDHLLSDARAGGIDSAVRTIHVRPLMYADNYQKQHQEETDIRVGMLAGDALGGGV